MDEAINQRFERIEKDIASLYKRSGSMEVWQGKYGEKIDKIESDIGRLTQSIDKLLEIPSKRWDTIVTVAITALVSGVIGSIIASFIAKGGF